MRRLPISAWLAPLALATCAAPPPPEVPVTPAPADTPHPPVQAAPRGPNEGPNGESASIAGQRVKITSPSGERLVEASALHPPPADRGLSGISPTALLFLEDGTLLVGLGDGTVSALAAAGNAKWRAGFSGAIRGLTAAGEGRVAVTTALGWMALLDREGRVLWDHHLTGEPLGAAVITREQKVLSASRRGVFAVASTGDILFSHAASVAEAPCESGSAELCPPPLVLEGEEVVIDGALRFPLSGPHPEVPSLTPVFPLSFQHVDGNTTESIVATGPDEITALVTHFSYRTEWDWGSDDKHEVLVVRGGKVTRTKVPTKAARKEVFLEGAQPELASLFVDALVPGPAGVPWLLGRRLSGERTTSMDSILSHWAGAGQLLDFRGGAVHELRDLFDVFAARQLTIAVAAAPEGPTRLLCFGEDKPACALREGAETSVIDAPGMVTAVRRVGDTEWILTKDGHLHRREGTRFVGAPEPPQAVIDFAAAGDKEVWARGNHPFTVHHHDGSSWREVPVPEAAGGFHPRSPHEAWSGRMRWDGKRWALVFGAPRAKAALWRSASDLWIGAGTGLHHATSPGPTPVTIPRAPLPDALPAPAPIPLGAPETHWRAARQRIDVSGGPALTAARSIAAAPDGSLWVLSWDRLVNIDPSGKATTARKVGEDSFHRWAAPTGDGRGLILGGRATVLAFDGRRGAPLSPELEHSVAAVAVNERGAAWIMGNPSGASDAFTAHALVRPAPEAPIQPVLGLPAATWVDVAVSPDGGAWFAGAVSPGPTGEGILFEAKGRLGTSGTVRRRAAAALLAVAASGAEEAWAVGAGGTVIHARGQGTDHYQLEPREWLRAVAAAGPDDVWIGGDAGALLHWDGRAFHPVPHPLGPRAAVTGITISRGAVWVVSPSGILRIDKRP